MQTGDEMQNLALGKLVEVMVAVGEALPDIRERGDLLQQIGAALGFTSQHIPNTEADYLFTPEEDERAQNN